MRLGYRNKKTNDKILTQSQKDVIAFENTSKVLEQRKKQDNSWMPKSINDQNAIFSKKLPYKRPMKKQNQLNTISINIFTIDSDFRPSCKKTSISTRNSNLFSNDQQQKQWKSSSKKTQNIPISKQQSRKNCFKSSNVPYKRASIDLSWNQNTKKQINHSRYSSNTQIKQNTNLFQTKKRVNSQINRSSIVFG